MNLWAKKSKSYFVGYPEDPQATAQAVADSLTASNGKQVIDFRHPDYCEDELFRDAWIGGESFVQKYLVRLSKREDPLSLAERVGISYCPALAKAAITEIKNTIFYRMSEVIRLEGTTSYNSAASGDKWGVDNLGSSMNNFMGSRVLPEMLAMRTVGVYIDRPILEENFNAMDSAKKRPYLYTYKHEDILAWVPDDSSEPNEFKVLLLRDNYLETEILTGLPLGWNTRYRLLKIVDGKLTITLYDNKSVQIGDVQVINMSVIPFVLFEMSESLLTDIAAYQVSLLNLASSDMSYAIKSNFPFYTEQYDPKTEPGFYKTGVIPVENVLRDAANINIPKQSAAQANTKEDIEVGNMHGRRHPVGTSTPEFIHPSSEPLLASMKKQEQLKAEIRQIQSLWLSNVTAGSVAIDQQDEHKTIDSGLNNIGMEMEHGERRVMAIWSMYEGQDVSGTISYPRTYTIKTDQERRTEAKEINELKSAIPSIDFQKEIAKATTYALFNGKLSQERIDKMFMQIDEAETMTCDCDEIAKDIEHNLVGLELASKARGYPKGQVELAKKEQAERLALVQAAQTAGGALKNPGARGVPDLSVDPKLDAKTEKQSTTIDPIIPPTQRGAGQ